MDFSAPVPAACATASRGCLPKWSPDIPGYSIVLGMHAFGLEETATTAGPKRWAGRPSKQPLDCWAHHAVAHVMEMQGRAEDGIGWMIAREPHWSGDDNFFKVHNWWHRALYHLDLGQVDQVFAALRRPDPAGRSVVVLDMVDASALLWRLQLSGHDVGDRWKELARAGTHADGRLYPFNDWHASWPISAPAAKPRSMRHQSARADAAGARRWRMGPALALPLVRGFRAFRRGDDARAPSAARRALHRQQFGGSHAQRDIIDWTLTEAALRGGLTALAEGLANERLALKPHSPINRGFLARARDRRSYVRVSHTHHVRRRRVTRTTKTRYAMSTA